MKSLDKKDNKFFDFDDYVQTNTDAHLIYAERNIGKSSYFLWKGGTIKSILQRYNDFHPDNIIWEEKGTSKRKVPIAIKEGKTGRFAYVRNAKNQTDMSIKMLLTLLPNCKISSTDRIIYKPFYEEDDVKQENPVWIEVGVILDFSTSFKAAKSYAFDGYDFMMWDECNEVSTRITNLYFKVINLLKTVQRFIKTFQFVIIGNKDTTNDELMTVFGVRVPEDSTKTYIFSRLDYGITCYIIGTKDFANLEQGNLLANKLANADDSTFGYLNDGGFGFDYSRKILTYKDYVKPTFQPIFKFIYGLNVFYFGSFIYDITNTKCFYIVRESKYTRWDNLAYLSFDVLGGSLQTHSIMLNKDTLNAYGKMFFYAFKQDVLYLNDFDCFSELIPLFTRINLDE